MLRCLFGPLHSHGGPNRSFIPIESYLCLISAQSWHATGRISELLQANQPLRWPFRRASLSRRPLLTLVLPFACDVSKECDCYCMMPTSVWEGEKPQRQLSSWRGHYCSLLVVVWDVRILKSVVLFGVRFACGVFMRDNTAEWHIQCLDPG
jgi:hypothetical protein